MEAKSRLENEISRIAEPRFGNPEVSATDAAKSGYIFSLFFSLPLVSKQRVYVSGMAQSVTLASNQALRGGRRRHRRTSWRRICNYANKRRPERTANGRRREKGRVPEAHNEFVRSRRRRVRRRRRRRKRRRGPRTKGRGRDTRRKSGGGWKRMEKDEEDEEGDHGSIVAFRIPCHPSVDFRPLPLRSPLRLLQPTCTPCSSPPPFVPSTTVPVIPQSPLPSSSLPTPPASSRYSHEALNPRPSSRTCIVDVHASLRRPRPTDQTSDSLFSPRLLSLPQPSSPHPRSSPRLVSLSISRARHFRPLSFPLSLFLPLPLSLFLFLLSQPPHRGVGGRSSRTE